MPLKLLNTQGDGGFHARNPPLSFSFLLHGLVQLLEHRLTFRLDMPLHWLSRKKNISG